MAEELRAVLRSGRILVGDGGMGTMLIERGVGDALCPELWNLTHPAQVLAVHRAYAKAGSDLMITNTFGCSRFKLAAAGVGEDRQRPLLEAAVKLARQAAGDERWVLGDIGPTGDLLTPLGTLDASEARQDFAFQARIFECSGADGIIIETMMDLNEMQAAVEGVRKGCKLPIIASMTFGTAGDGYRTMFGQSPQTCARVLEELGVDVIGVNCTVGIREMIDIVNTMRNACSLPIMAQPNAGTPELIDGANVYPDTAEEMAAFVGALLNAGTTIVGGCCGTTPDFIRHLRASIPSQPA